MKMIIVKARSVIELNGGSDAALSDYSVLEHIVVPLDGEPESERAVSPALTIAERLGADVHLLTTKAEIGDLTASAYLEMVAAGITVPVTTEVVEHSAPTGAISSAASSDRTAVCMATHARGRLRGAVHPNNAESVVDAITAPVFLIGPNCHDARLDGIVMMAHDGTEQATRVGWALLPLIAALGRSLWVVTVVEGPMGKPTDDPFKAIRATVQPLIDAATHAGLEAAHHLAFGRNAAAALLDEIGNIGPSMVVVAASHHSWLDRVREGSTTIAVVHGATVPVLVAHVE